MGKIKPYLVGLIAALVTISMEGFIEETYVYDISALLLTTIPGIYVGFALVDGRKWALVGEIAQALLFICLGLAGLRISPWFLVAGYFGHGIWDLLHHSKGLHTKPPQGYASFCFMYDWVIAGALAVLIFT